MLRCASGRAATDDINVQCVFNNAGFIVTGFFDSSPEEKQMGNLECNATAAAKVPDLPWPRSFFCVVLESVVNARGILFSRHSCGMP